MDDLEKQIMEIINGEINSAVATNGVLNSGKFPHPLTLARLAEQAESFKKQFPPMPKYYRVNQRTYDSLKKMSMPATNDFYRSIASVELRVDNDVPDGEAWPPDKRIEFVLHNPPPRELRSSPYVETVEEIPIEEAKRRYPEMFGKDACEICHGEKGGVPGNENNVDGVVMCDYCDVELHHPIKKDEHGN